MRYFVSMVLIMALSVSVMCAGSRAQDYFALEELHLISWEDLSEGHPSHTGPVSAAIVMAWYATHGYPQLLPDLNHDAEIDGRDTILLAQEFAEEMVPDYRNDVYDPHVVSELASYVGMRYPDEFSLLIFDPTFSNEYREWMGTAYDSERYPGVEILLLDEPDYDTYVNLLEDYHPGIVGYGMEPEANRYSVSRSHERNVDDEEGPVDLANTDREYFGPGLVWETELRWDGNRWRFASPEWVPFEIFVVLIPHDLAGEDTNDGSDYPDAPPGGSSDGGSGEDSTPPPGSSEWGSGSNETEPDPPPGGSSSSVNESSDLTINMFNSGPEAMDAAHAAPGEQVRYILQVWHTGPDLPRVTVAELTVPFGAQIDWIEGNPAEMAGWPGRHFVWSIPDGSLQVANPAAGMTPGVDAWLREFQITVDESVCSTLQFDFEVSSTIPDPNLLNNLGTLVESFGPCDGGQPASNELPNLWVTNMTGCWEWSNDGQEHVITTVTGIVHNGGQATASGVRARVTAGGASRTVYIGTIFAGGQKTVSATIDIGPYDNVSWVVPTSITADPSNHVQEADESNNTTDSSFPESSECN